MMSVSESPPQTRCRTSRNTPSTCKRLVQVLLLFLLTSLTTTLRATVDAREVHMLPIAWLSQNGQLTDTEQYFASFMLLPVAVKHFNERDNTIIPDLSIRTKNCNATINIFGGYIRDGKGLQNVAMGHLVEAISKFERLDIVHGPTQSDVAQSITMAAGALRIPVLSHTATANLLSDKTTFPTFFRLVPSDTQIVEKIADLLVFFKYKTVGVIHTSDAYGISFRNAITDSCARRRIQISSVFYDSLAQGEELEAQVKSSLKVLVNQNISVIIKNVLLASHELAIAKAAFDLNWIKHKLYIGRRSALRELSTGDRFAREFARGQLAVVPSYNERNPIYERLLRYMPRINVSFVNEFLPQNSSGLKPGLQYQLPNDFFSRTQSLEGMRFNAAMYDSIIALGLAACDELAIIDKTMTESPLTRITLIESLKKVRFAGVTGKVQFDQNQDRDSSAITFGLENLVDNGTHLIRVNVGLTESNGRWNITKPIIFSDGSTTPPPDIVRAEIIFEYLPLEAKIFGWIEGGIGIIFGLFTICRLIHNRLVHESRHRQQQQGQVQEAYTSEMMTMNVDSNNNKNNNLDVGTNNAEFFYLKFSLALATTALASSILTLTRESNLSCSLFPWLFVMSLGVILLCLIIHAIQTEVLCSDGWVGNGIKYNARVSEQAMINNRDHLVSTSASKSPWCSFSVWLNRLLFCGQFRLAGARALNKQQQQRESGRLKPNPMSKEKACVLLTIALASYLLFFIMLAGLIVAQILVPFEWTYIVLKHDEDGIPIVSSMGCVVAGLSSNNDDLRVELENPSNKSRNEEREWTMIVFIVIVVAVGLLAFLTLFTSTWLKTNSKDDGASSKMSTLASLCVFQVFFVGLPTAATVWYAALSRFLVLSSVAFATCTIIFTTMFWTRFFCCCLQRRWRLRPTQLPDPNISSSFHNNSFLNNNQLRQLRFLEMAQEREVNLKRRSTRVNNNEQQQNASNHQSRLLLILEKRIAGESIQDEDEDDAGHQDGITPGMRRRVPYSDEEDAKTTVHSNHTRSSIGGGAGGGQWRTSIGHSPAHQDGSPSHRSSSFQDEIQVALGMINYGNAVDDKVIHQTDSMHSGSIGDGIIGHQNVSPQLDVSQYSSAMQKSIRDGNHLERTKSLPSFVNLEELQANLGQPSVIITNVPPPVAVPPTLASIVTRNEDDVGQPIASILATASPPPPHLPTATNTSSSNSTSAATTALATSPQRSQSRPNNNIGEGGEVETVTKLDLA